MSMKSVFILAYFPKCTKHCGLYSYLVPPCSKSQALYQSEIRVAQCLPRIAPCQVFHSSTCIS